jgi:uncharacterized cupin superfamily protein
VPDTLQIDDAHAREDEVFYVLSGRGRWVGISLPMR